MTNLLIYYRINNKMTMAMIMVSLTALKTAKLLYVSSTQCTRACKENPFLYFQFGDFKDFQLFKLQWH